MLQILQLKAFESDEGRKLVLDPTCEKTGLA
jgi:hypothetical protein